MSRLCIERSILPSSSGLQFFFFLLSIDKCSFKSIQVILKSKRYPDRMIHLSKSKFNCWMVRIWKILMSLIVQIFRAIITQFRLSFNTSAFTYFTYFRKACKSVWLYANIFWMYVVKWPSAKEFWKSFRYVICLFFLGSLLVYFFPFLNYL